MPSIPLEFNGWSWQILGEIDLKMKQMLLSPYFLFRDFGWGSCFILTFSSSSSKDSRDTGLRASSPFPSMGLLCFEFLHKMCGPAPNFCFSFINYVTLFLFPQTRILLVPKSTVPREYLAVIVKVFKGKKRKETQAYPSLSLFSPCGFYSQ